MKGRTSLKTTRIEKVCYLCMEVLLLQVAILMAEMQMLHSKVAPFCCAECQRQGYTLSWEAAAEGRLELCVSLLATTGAHT